MQTVEVYADISCPFTHGGLKRVVQHVRALSEPAEVIVRAWPFGWVNGAPLDVDAMLVKAAALADQLGVDDFVGLRADAWPTSTIPTHDLPAPSGGTSAAVQADYDGGLARGSRARRTSSSHPTTSSVPRSTSATTPTVTSRRGSTPTCSPTSSPASTHREGRTVKDPS